MPLPHPPIAEEHKIVGFIEREETRLTKVVTCLLNEIELIREYRTRLVSDVVTGKLDVRGVSVSAIDEDEIETLVKGDELEAEAPDQTEETAYADD